MDPRQALNTWLELDLNGLQQSMDSQSLDIFKIQSSSLESKRRLAEKTKEFKKIVSPTADEIKTLIKEYQKEIDSINKRSKQGESIFLNIYKRLAQAPGYLD